MEMEYQSASGLRKSGYNLAAHISRCFIPQQQGEIDYSDPHLKGQTREVSGNPTLVFDTVVMQYGDYVMLSWASAFRVMFTHHVCLLFSQL